MEDSDCEKIDALDALLCLGYNIVKETEAEPGCQPGFRLCSANADLSTPEDRMSIYLLLQEIEGNKFYSDKIIDIGRKLP